MKLSICMIVKNEARRIANCVKRHLPLADEIIVVDTGSTDGTAELAQEAGAIVSHFTWCDDFAAARNAALDAATGDWAFALDADEWIDEQDFLKLRILCEGAPAVYSVMTHTFSNEAGTIDWHPLTEEYKKLPELQGYTGYLTSPKIRLFPLRPDVRFEGEIHELVEYSAARAGLPLHGCDIIVRHLQDEHAVNPESLYRKREQYLHLSRVKVKNNPDSAKPLHELGMVCMEMGLVEEGVTVLEKAHKLAPQNNTILLLYATMLLRAEKYAQVRDLLAPHSGQKPKIVKQLAHNEMALSGLGEALWNLGELDAAEEFLLRALKIRPQHFHALLFLGRLRMSQGNAPVALELFKAAVALSPECEIATTNAGICAAALGDLDTAKRFLEMSVHSDGTVWLPHFYLGQIARAQGRVDDARKHLNLALTLDPNNPRVMEQISLLPA
ncbi:TPA: hypothetical protein DDW35_01435 [Candidatus Sumerlaeota bacterium]|jgi:O-antigen biosynthesis protein|nr:hypothetical protein [Candidatus Sumerlaeota bacterium]